MFCFSVFELSNLKMFLICSSFFTTSSLTVLTLLSLRRIAEYLLQSYSTYRYMIYTAALVSILIV